MVKNRVRLGLVVLLLANIIKLKHGIECFMLARNQGFMAIGIIGVVKAWLIRNTGKQCRFGNRKLLGRFTKVGLRATFNTVAAATVR